MAVTRTYGEEMPEIVNHLEETFMGRFILTQFSLIGNADRLATSRRWSATATHVVAVSGWNNSANSQCAIAGAVDAGSVV